MIDLRKSRDKLVDEVISSAPVLKKIASDAVSRNMEILEEWRKSGACDILGEVLSLLEGFRHRHTQYQSRIPYSLSVMEAICHELFMNLIIGHLLSCFANLRLAIESLVIGHKDEREPNLDKQVHGKDIRDFDHKMGTQLHEPWSGTSEDFLHAPGFLRRALRKKERWLVECSIGTIYVDDDLEDVCTLCRYVSEFRRSLELIVKR